MNIDIHPLSTDRLNDYLRFFDGVAFADHPEWSQCYCLAFHFEPAWDAEDAGRENPWRERAIRFVREEKMRGYLAYIDENVVGWCNANDRNNYAALNCDARPEIWDDNKGLKIKSIVCFLVAPGMRGKRIATKLLEKVCADAKAEGYDFAEGYPPAGDWDMYAAHHGTVKLFEKNGFTTYKHSNNAYVMRKNLKNE